MHSQHFVRVGCEILLTQTVIYVKTSKWRLSRFCNFVKVGYEILLAPTLMYMKTSIGDIAESATLSV